MKSVLITGSNRGIGLSLAKYYSSKSGWKVWAACRSSSEALDVTGAHVIAGVDVSSSACEQVLKESLGDSKIDLLINNAGILRNEILGELDFDSILEQFKVNSLGMLRVTQALLGSLNPEAKIAIIGSRMGSVEDNTSGGRYGYRMSKAALNMAAMSVAKDLAHQNIPVGIIHPGLVSTDMIGRAGDIEPDDVAVKIADRIEELDMSKSGCFVHANGTLLPW